MDAERKFLYRVKAKVVELYMYRLGCNLSLNIYAFSVHFMSTDIFCRLLKLEGISLSLSNATALIIFPYHSIFTLAFNSSTNTISYSVASYEGPNNADVEIFAHSSGMLAQSGHLVSALTFGLAELRLKELASSKERLHQPLRE